MRHRVTRLRTALAQLNADRTGSRRAFTDDLRAEALSYRSDRRSEGATNETISKELGLGQSTLEKWRRQASAFRRVRPTRGAVAVPSTQRAESPDRGISVCSATITLAGRAN